MEVTKIHEPVGFFEEIVLPKPKDASFRKDAVENVAEEVFRGIVSEEHFPVEKS